MEHETDMRAFSPTAVPTSSAPLSSAPIRSGALPRWQSGELALPDPFVLESGQALRNARLAWQCAGPADAPLVIALGGISAHRRVCADDARSGWWQAQCGEQRALDTRNYRVLGIDWLG